MANTAVAKNAMAAAFAAGALWGELASTAPGSTPGTPISGPARVALSWTAGAAGVITASAPFIGIPAGLTAYGVNYYSASTGGTYFDGYALGTPEVFSNAGSMTVALSETVG